MFDAPFSTAYLLKLQDPFRFRTWEGEKPYFHPDKPSQINKFLYDLGFNLSPGRKQGKKLIRLQGRSLAVDWTQHKPADIMRGKIWTEQRTKPGEYFSEDIGIDSVIKNHYINAQKEKVNPHKLCVIKHGDFRSKKIAGYLIDEITAQDCRRIDNTYGLDLRRDSGTICLDIDAHGSDTRTRERALHALKIVLDDMNQLPIYAEVSPAGGFHCYYKFPHQVDYDQVRDFIEGLNKKHNVNIELAGIGKVVQLPDSAAYWPIKLHADGGYEFYQDRNFMEDAKRYNADDSRFQPLPTGKESEQKNDISSALREITARRIKEQNQKANIYINDYTGQNHDHAGFNFNEGERCAVSYHGGGFYWYKASNGDYRKYTALIHKHNQGSKDLAGEDAEKYIRENFEWIQSKYDPEKMKRRVTKADQEFGSNLKYLTDEEKELARRVSTFQPNPRRYGKTRADYRTGSALAAAEIMGRIAFEGKTSFRRIVDLTSGLTLKKIIEYQTGYVFYADQIAQHIKKTLPDTDTSAVVRDTIRFLIRAGFFSEYKHHVSFRQYPIQKRYLLPCNGDDRTTDGEGVHLSALSARRLLLLIIALRKEAADAAALSITGGKHIIIRPNLGTKKEAEKTPEGEKNEKPPDG